MEGKVVAGVVAEEEAGVEEEGMKLLHHNLYSLWDQLRKANQVLNSYKTNVYGTTGACFILT